jgi:hypothetical protein
MKVWCLAVVGLITSTSDRVQAAIEPSAANTSSVTIVVQPVGSRNLPEALRKGKAAFDQRDFRLSRDILRQELKKDNEAKQLSQADRRLLVVTLAMTYREIGLLDQGEELLNGEIKADPNYALYHYGLAVFFAEEELVNKRVPDRSDRDSKKKDAKRLALKSLRAAYENRANLGQGEMLPNPKADNALAPLLKAPEFQALFKEQGLGAENNLESDLSAMIGRGRVSAERIVRK